MFKRIFIDALEKWKGPLREEWKKNGLWSLLASIISFPIINYLIGGEEARIEVIIFISLIAGIIISQTFRFLWLLVSSPFMIIREQDNKIANLKSVSDRKSIIGKLVELREEGTKLRNSGQTILHQSGIEPWWGKHLEWREKTKATIALLDPNKANQWGILNTYIPKRGFPNAINNLHRKYLQMFDAWLDRLQEVIDKLDIE